MYAYEIENYVAGFRFSDDSEIFRDNSTQEFKDLSGFASLGQNLKNRAGTQSFENIGGTNNRKGLVLDGSNHLEFNNPVAWGGSFVAAFKIEFIGQNVTLSEYLMLDGDAVLPANNSNFVLTNFSGVTRGDWLTFSNRPSAQEVLLPSSVTSATVVIARSISQEESMGFSTTDGVVVNQSAEVPAGSNKGISLAPCRGLTTRLGNLSGVLDDLTVSTNYKITMLEMHFFKDNIISNQLPKTKTFIETLKSYYA